MTTLADIRYDHAQHRYTAADDGRVILSVTQVLQRAGIIDTTFMTEAGRDRGTAVHEATEDMDTWGTDWYDTSELVRQYAKAYQKWIDSSRALILDIEQKVYGQVKAVGKTYEYCGRYDRLVRLARYPWLVLDLKSGAPAWWHKIQGVAYSLAEGSGAWPACLYLRKNGTYSLDIVSDREYMKARAEWIEALKKVSSMLSKAEP